MIKMSPTLRHLCATVNLSNSFFQMLDFKLQLPTYLANPFSAVFILQVFSSAHQTETLFD